MQYKPQSIKEKGLDVYLDSTKQTHNGLGWSDFKQRLDLRVPKPRIASDFGVGKQTIWTWVNIYKEEIQNADSKTN